MVGFKHRTFCPDFLHPGDLLLTTYFPHGHGGGVGGAHGGGGGGGHGGGGAGAGTAFMK